MPIPALIGGALIGAAGSAGSSFIQNAGNRRSQKRQHRQNIDLWQRQNEYNHPMQQMQRLRQAGLNPNLVYGKGVQGAAGMADKPAPASQANYTFDNPLRDLSTVASLRAIQAQTNNTEAGTAVKVQEALQRAVQTARGNLDLGVAKELRETSVQAAQQNLRNLQLNATGMKLNNEYNTATMGTRIKTMSATLQQIVKQTKGQEQLNALRALETEYKQMGIDNGGMTGQSMRMLYRLGEKIKQELNKF